MLAADVAIVGAGPAGSVAALNLAPFHRVLLIDRQAVPPMRIGESLPGAARRLLADMGLWDGFLTDGHAPCHALSGAWGAAEPVERDMLTDPDGHGWHLDRARFDRRLRAVAAARGATLLVPARPRAIQRSDGGWHLTIEHEGQTQAVEAKMLIDAGGRLSRLLQPHGAERQTRDRLICGWLRFAQSGMPPGITRIEAEAEGWWYAAALPNAGSILAFHTDADLPAARSARSAAALLARVRGLPVLGPLLNAGTWAGATAGFCAAHSARLACPAGDGWLAIGDAALAFDPLASQGLFNALYTGLAAAEAADRHLSGDATALPDYAATLRPVAETYDAHLAAWYGVERRWPEQPFWRRRLGAGLECERPPRTHDAVTPGMRRMTE